MIWDDNDAQGIEKVVLVIEAYFLNGDNATCNVGWKHDY